MQKSSQNAIYLHLSKNPYICLETALAITLLQAKKITGLSVWGRIEVNFNLLPINKLLITVPGIGPHRGEPPLALQPHRHTWRTIAPYDVHTVSK